MNETVNKILTTVAALATKKHGCPITVEYLVSHKRVPIGVKENLTGAFGHSRIIAVNLLSIHTSLRNKDIAAIMNYKYQSTISNSRKLVREKLRNKDKEFTEYYQLIVNSLNQQI